MIQINRDICSNFDKAIEKEWLETNSLGGYASSTIIGVNTRGYHGLLVAAEKPPVGRKVMLSKVDEVVSVNGRRYDISCNQYSGAIYPEGYKYMDSFRIDPFPIFRYILDDVVIEKSVFMIHGENTTLVAYRLVESSKPVTLEIRPFVACRGFHERLHEADNPGIDVQWEKGSIFVNLNGTGFYLSVNGGVFHATGYWYKNFEYRIEAERGQETHEDLYNPGYFVYKLVNEKEFALAASEHDPSCFDLEKLRADELRYRLGNNYDVAYRLKQNDKIHSGIASLMSASDQFLVKREDFISIIAGYHWFEDWGRDTMISLPGLALVTGKYDAAKDILLAYAGYCDRGMIPNRFPESGEQPEYNTVDAALWFIYAAKKFLDYTDDLKFIELELYPVLAKIIRHYSGGTRYNIHTDTDGLLYAGEKGSQITWMDAKIGNFIVTPRYGKPVEVNALWYNALRTMRELSGKLGYDGSAHRYSQMAEKVRKSFNDTFWNKAEGCLYDYVDGNYADDSIRPNQIFAISLPYQVLPEERAKSVLNVVQRELLTPFGLRSLSPKHKNYIGTYSGDQYSRDIAYHQGTVWAWLLGPFITAYVNINGRSKETEGFINDLISEIINNHLNDAGLGYISEIFDGDPPHRPRGCIAQAWSVAEVLRAYVEM